MNFAFDLTINLALIFAIATAAIGWVRYQLNSLHGRIDGLREEQRTIDKRVTGAEQGLIAIPSHRDMHQLQLTLSDMRGEMREMRAVMDGNQQIMGRLETIVTRHEDHLLDGAKR